MNDSASAAPTYDQVVAAWNAQADKYNQWDELGEDEKIEWALKFAQLTPPTAAPSDAELFPLIEKHFGMVPRRDDTVIDRRNGRFHDAQRYRDFAADLLSARAQPTPPAVVEPLTDEQIVGVMHSIPINAAPSYHIAFARAIEAAHGIKGGQHGTE